MARLLVLLFASLASFQSFAVTAAQPTRDLDKLYEKAKFKIEKKTFSAYVADDDAGREQGLMYITKLPEDTGMLFVFNDERSLGFWMKNTLIPLAIAFIDHNGLIVDIQEMETANPATPDKVPTYYSKNPAQLALEMSKGWFTKNKLKVGDRLTTVPPVKSALLKRVLPSKH